MRRALSLLLVLTAACGGDGPSEPSIESRMSGSWTLVSIDGRTIPAQWPDPASNFCDYGVSSGSLSLGPNQGVKGGFFRLTWSLSPRTQGGTCIGRPGETTNFNDVAESGWAAGASGLRVYETVNGSLIPYAARLGGNDLVVTVTDDLGSPDGEYRYRKVGQ